ncbi:hypothetical protein GCM10020256_53080 [Streptomyces thermocoprophilus]
MRVVIAEDSAILRDGLAELLRLRHVEVAAAVADAGTLLTAVAEHTPDVAVVDIRLPPTHTDEGYGPPYGCGRSTRRRGCCCSPSTSRRPTPPDSSATRPGSATC